MFKFTLSPQFSDDVLTIEKVGQSLIVNGMAYDFSLLNDGDAIPPEAITNPHIIDSITKDGGIVNITILMPYSDAEAPNEVLFPAPLFMTNDHVVKFNVAEEEDDRLL